MYQEVKCQLEVLHKTYQSAGSNDAKESAIVLIKDQMQKFIEQSLKSGLDPDKVKSEIDSLCFKEAVIPSILLEWVGNEFEEKKREFETRLSTTSAYTHVQTHGKESRFFEKKILYHAGLCCEAVSTCEKGEDIAIFFKSKSPMHALDEVSFCDKDFVKPYLVAKQGKNIYVAFRSETFISEFKKAGYDEGKLLLARFHVSCNYYYYKFTLIVLKSQASHVPVRFLTELLWSHHTIVLTGKPNLYFLHSFPNLMFHN